MADKGNPGAKRLSIKTYPNRRYYDATRSRHVTLEEIHGLIREGYEVQVTDSRTGQDITAKVLAQIIIELDPPKLGVFPVALLHGLLRSNEQAVTDLTRRYFEHFLGFLLTSRKDLGGYLQRSMGLPGPAPTFADWARMMWGPLGMVPPGQEGPAGRPAAPPEAGDTAPPAGMPAPAQDVREQIESLRGQLEALRQKLSNPSRRRATRPGRKSPPRRPAK